MEAATTAREGRTSAGEAILEVKNIEVVYNDVILVLRGLSLEAPQGHRGAAGRQRGRQVDDAEGDLRPAAIEDGAVTRGAFRSTASDQRLDRRTVVQRGIFQVMEGRRIVQDMT